MKGPSVWLSVGNRAPGGLKSDTNRHFVRKTKSGRETEVSMDQNGCQQASIDLTESKVLIVEDSHFFQQVLKEILQTRFPSVEVQVSSNGEEALRKIEGMIPDIVFMDIRLPGENGLSVARKIKADYPDISIVVFTSYDTAEYREAAQQEADYFFSKGSTSRAEIFSLVESILSTKASIRSSMK